MCILMKIGLASLNDSFAWRPYESEEARPVANIEVPTKVYYFLPNLNHHFRTFNIILADILEFASILQVTSIDTYSSN